jgi:hypothetical protein
MAWYLIKHKDFTFTNRLHCLYFEVNMKKKKKKKTLCVYINLFRCL